MHTFRGVWTEDNLDNLITEEVSNAFIFCASIMSLFLKTLIIQNLKLRSQNKTVGYDLHHFIYAHVKNYDISILFWLSSRACKKKY